MRGQTKVPQESMWTRDGLHRFARPIQYRGFTSQETTHLPRGVSARFVWSKLVSPPRKCAHRGTCNIHGHMFRLLLDPHRVGCTNCICLLGTLEPRTVPVAMWVTMTIPEKARIRWRDLRIFMEAWSVAQNNTSRYPAWSCDALQARKSRCFAVVWMHNLLIYFVSEHTRKQNVTLHQIGFNKPDNVLIGKAVEFRFCKHTCYFWHGISWRNISCAKCRRMCRPSAASGVFGLRKHKNTTTKGFKYLAHSESYKTMANLRGITMQSCYLYTRHRNRQHESHVACQLISLHISSNMTFYWIMERAEIILRTLPAASTKYIRIEILRLYW